MQTKGFTLVELLIVIGILAILTAAVVIILNPGELLKQARDSQRMSDLDAVKSAISLYLTDAATPSITGNNANCYVYTGSSSAAACGSRFASGTTTTVATRVTDGTGWIPVNFGSISGGSPLSTLPVDPSQGTTYYYAYKGDNTNLVFEINAVLESTKYATSKQGSDGGNSASIYEVGNDPGLDL